MLRENTITDDFQVSIVWVLQSVVLRSTGKAVGKVGQRKANDECINEEAAPKNN